MRIKDIIKAIETHAPTGVQETYDNSGLITGDPEKEIDAVLICLDVTQEVIEEALSKGISFIISHHPVVFKGIKRLVPGDPVSEILIRTVQNDLALYAAHTNLDKVIPGVSSVLADQIGLVNQQVLLPDSDSLVKLVTFIPTTHVQEVASALFDAGAGRIGNYDSCSFSLAGEGTFRPLAGSNPYAGRQDELHREQEIRFEAVFPAHLKFQITSTLKALHPYEEVAYDLLPMMNNNPHLGLGVYGDLREEMSEEDFLSLLKNHLALNIIRHSAFTGKMVRKVALCGGSGSEFLSVAKACGAQVYISADFKYHQFFEADGKLMIADIGHYESEIFAVELLERIVTKKFPTFAVHLSEVNTNPIKFF